MNKNLTTAQQIEVIELRMKELDEQSSSAAKIWITLNDQKRELEEQMIREHANEVWLELPKNVRALFVPEERDTGYTRGKYEDGLYLHYTPVSYDNERADRFYMHFTRDKMVEAHDLLGKVIETFLRE